jgi:hypothetical protein
MMSDDTLFDETEEDGFEVNARIDLSKDPYDPRLDKINPFAERDGKTLSWSGVNMTVVRIVIFNSVYGLIAVYFPKRTMH